MLHVETVDLWKGDYFQEFSLANEMCALYNQNPSIVTIIYLNDFYVTAVLSILYKSQVEQVRALILYKNNLNENNFESCSNTKGKPPA